VVCHTDLSLDMLRLRWYFVACAVIFLLSHTISVEGSGLELLLIIIPIITFFAGVASVLLGGFLLVDSLDNPVF
jgi:hypothetical protein